MNEKQPSDLTISRRALFDRAWSKPMTTNAAELGTTAPLLAALARRIGLPLPRAGHWMKKEVGREPPTPDFPENPSLDAELYPIAPPPLPRMAVSRPPRTEKRRKTTEGVEPSQLVEGAVYDKNNATAAGLNQREEHRTVARTRKAIGTKSGSDRVMIGGQGYFRLLLVPDSGARACAILDKLVADVEAQGWKIQDSEQGYVIARKPVPSFPPAQSQGRVEPHSLCSPT